MLHRIKKSVGLDKCCRFCHYYDGTNQCCTNEKHYRALGYEVDVQIRSHIESGMLWENLKEELLPKMYSAYKGTFERESFDMGRITRKKVDAILEKTFEENETYVLEIMDTFMSEYLQNVDVVDKQCNILDPENHTCEEWC